MNAEAIVAVSAAVVTLCQLLKWAFIPDKYGPVAVLILSAVGVALWVWSEPDPITRAAAFGYFAGWLAVSLNAAGIYGFTRASGEALVRMAPPPGGAGSSPTVKP